MYVYIYIYNSLYHLVSYFSLKKPERRNVCNKRFSFSKFAEGLLLLSSCIFYRDRACCPVSLDPSNKRHS